MPVQVEFFGIARQRAGTSGVTVSMSGDTIRLDELFHVLADRCPQWAAECLEGDCLRAGYLANINGQRFVRDPRTTMRSGDELLIMSADAGG